MIEKFLQFKDRFDAFSLRERLMFSATIFLVLYVIFDMVAMAAIQHRSAETSAKLKNLAERNKTLDEKIIEVSSQIKEISEPGSDSEISSLRSSLRDTNKQLENIVVKFVKPQEMAQVLREVLKDVNGLKLMRVKSVEVVNLLSNIKDASVAEHDTKYSQALRLLRLYQQQVQVADNAELQGKVAKFLEKQESQDRKDDEIPQIYKHGILIELRGSYTATLQYLRMLENLPWKFYWEAMRFEIDDYPNAKIIIVINTLSLNKDWVRV